MSTQAAIAATSTAEVADAVRDATARRTPLRMIGGGHWLGAPSPAARITPHARDLNLSALTGITNYVPADLTLSVRAGTTLAELDAATAPNGQWCPLLAWGGDAGTIGATFATATTGPCAAALGRPRDIALGLEFVDGNGTVVRGGGRVVKNVAGFDLTRLIVGSFGAFGVITEVTVRLRARPPVDATWCLAPADRARTTENTNATTNDLVHNSGSALLTRIRRGDIVPLACEAIDERMGAALGLRAGTVLVRYGGNRTLVEAARAALAREGAVTDADPALWRTLRALDPHPRISGGNSLAGTVPARIKAQFDPYGILNPGVLGELA